MRFAERFLVVFAVLSLVMRLCGLKDGPTMELIALPLLALFYIIAMPFLLSVLGRAEDGRLAWGPILVAALFGLAMAYCIISLMLYTLGWLPKTDMLVNCCIILGLLSIGSAIGARTGRRFIAMAGLRVRILLGVVIFIALLNLPNIGALSRGAF